MAYYWWQRALGRWWRVLAVGLVLGLIGGGLTNLLSPKTYSAVIQLQFNRLQTPGIPSAADLDYNDQLANSYGALLKSQPFLQETIAQLALPFTPEELRRHILIRQLSGSQRLEVVVTDTNKDRALNTASRLSALLIQYAKETQANSVQGVRAQVDRDLAEAHQRVTTASARLDQLRATPIASSDILVEAMRLHEELSQYQAIYLSLLETQQRMELDRVQAENAISIAIPAYLNSETRRGALARLLLNIILGGFLGLASVMCYVGVRELRDQRLRDTAELAQRGVTQLAVLPLIRHRENEPDSLTSLSRDQHFAEGIRRLRAQLLVSDAQVIGISSAVRGEGVSTVSAQLALSMAQAGRCVALIDANLRAPALHRLLRAEAQPGLSDYLQQSNPMPLPIQTTPDGVDLIAGGANHADPAALLASPKMAALLTTLRATADIILLDLPPVLPVSDALMLQPLLNGTIMVLDASTTGLPSLDRARDLLHNAQGTIVGLVVNRSTDRANYIGVDVGSNYLPPAVRRTGEPTDANGHMPEPVMAGRQHDD